MILGEFWFWIFRSDLDHIFFFRYGSNLFPIIEPARILIDPDLQLWGKEMYLQQRQQVQFMQVDPSLSLFLSISGSFTFSPSWTIFNAVYVQISRFSSQI